MKNISLSPNGTEYQLPTEKQSAKELEELKRITTEQRKLGRQIVAVQGLGFVGCVMAAVVADAVDEEEKSLYFAHGQQRASARSFWKVPVINQGIPPVSSSDAEVPKIYHRTVVEKKHFVQHGSIMLTKLLILSWLIFNLMLQSLPSGMQLKGIAICPHSGMA